MHVMEERGNGSFEMTFIRTLGLHREEKREGRRIG
jgi:hypothetical protein